MNGLGSLLDETRVLVCCGPGGVGKTTISATLGLVAAQRGRRACVLTVDPAKRLADALGLDELGAVATEVPGVGPGTLHALMLDTAATFDGLIEVHASSPEQAEAIRANRLYRSLATALSGTQEYMAMEKLYELTSSGDYDLVIVDTPPTRNALDLLDAPRRLTSFLENRIFRALLLPTKGVLRAVTFATRSLLGAIGKVAGAELVADAVTFFQAFAGMEEGFSARAGAVHELLREEGTSFLLVTSPRPDAIEEATFFAQRLEDAAMSAAGIVVNRVHPRFAAHPVRSGLLEAKGALGELAANLARLQSLAEAEDQALQSLRRRVDDGSVVAVPLLSGDIHDLEGLGQLGDLLVGEQAGRW